MATVVTVSRWDNSLGLSIPVKVAKALNLAAGDIMRMEIEENAILFTKIDTTVFDMSSAEFEDACRDAVLNRGD